jgi:hypothetical protein
VALEVAGSKPVTRPIILCMFRMRKMGAANGLAGRLIISSKSQWKFAGVAELVDALVLGTSGESRGGSSPSARTIGACLNRV